MIRKVQNSDCVKLDQFIVDFIKYESENFDENGKRDLVVKGYIRNKMVDENSIILVCEEDNDIIGFILGGILRGNLVKKTDEAKIETLFVKEEYRNKGLGTELIEAFVKECKLSNVSYVRIDNYLSNVDAGRLYEKLGFKELVIERRKKI